MQEKLKSQEEEKLDLQEKINRLSKLILDSSSVSSSHVFHSMMRRNHKTKKETPEDDSHSNEISDDFTDDSDDDIIKLRNSEDSLDTLSDGTITPKPRKVSEKRSKHEDFSFLAEIQEFCPIHTF